MAITYPQALPDINKVAGLRLTARSVVAISQSPFTGQQQVQEHGGQWWELELTLPPMLRAEAEPWNAFLLKLNGMRGTFLAGDPVSRRPRGTITGAPTVNGAHAVRSKTLAITNVPVGQTLLTGDYVQVGSGEQTRLHKVLLDATANASGQMTLDIFPSLREALANGAAVVYNDCLGTFRLASNQMAWDVSLGQFMQISIAAIEAL